MARPSSIAPVSFAGLSEFARLGRREFRFRGGELGLELLLGELFRRRFVSGGLFELLHRLADSAGKFGQLFRAEEQDQHAKDEDDLGRTDKAEYRARRQ